MLGSSKSPKPSQTSDKTALLDRGVNKARKQWMWREGTRLQFRVELNADKPWMIGQFYNFRQRAVWRQT